MPTVNQLASVDSVTAGDQFVVFVTNQGDSRKAAISVLQAYMQANLSFGVAGVGQYVTQYAAPATTGFTVAVASAAGNTHIILTPTGTLAAGTITLPSAVAAVDAQLLLVNTTQAVTALTIAANGATSVIGAPTTLAANAFFTLKFDLPTKNWYRVG